MASALDRIRMITNFFQQFNKDPEKDSKLVNFFLSELQGYTDEDIQYGINLLINEGKHQYLPKVFELKKFIDARNPQEDPPRVPCFICVGFGWVMEVIGVGPGGHKIKPMTFKCKSVEGYRFLTWAGGRCNCVNGQRMGSKLDFIEPLSDIKEKARKDGTTCVWVADKWADELNGVEPRKPSKELIKKVEAIMKKAQEEHNQKQQQIIREEKRKSLGELFAQEINSLNIGEDNGETI